MVRKQKHGSVSDRYLASRYLSVMHYNIEGVVSDTYGNKITDDDLLSMVRGHDICAFTETHASDNVKLEIEGYVIKRLTRPKSSRAKKFSGGIALAVKQNIAHNVEILKSKSENIMWARIKLRGAKKDFLLGIVYISPMNSSYTKNVLSNPFRTWEILEDEIAKYKSAFNISVIGDFNANINGYFYRELDKFARTQHFNIADVASLPHDS